MGTVIKTIAKQIYFLEYRVIKASTVSLQLIANQLKANQETRITKAIDGQGKKLNEIVQTENDLNQKSEQKDNSRIENIALAYQLNLSTLTM